MKKHHCCIPGCNAYDTLGNFLSMPCESHWRHQWLFKIKRRHWVVDATTVACRRHFENPDIKISTKAIRKGNRETKKILVSTHSAPSILPDLNTKSSKKAENIFPECMFHLYHRDCDGPSTLAEIQNADFLWSYSSFKIMYPKRLQMLFENTWKVATTMDEVIFYTIDFSETPRIPSSVRVDKNLLVNVTLAGRSVDPCDLTWILPITGRLNRWSQLQTMLTVFGK